MFGTVQIDWYNPHCGSVLARNSLEILMTFIVVMGYEIHITSACQMSVILSEFVDVLTFVITFYLEGAYVHLNCARMQNVS